jgi:hypothetical protein
MSLTQKVLDALSKRSGEAKKLNLNQKNKGVLRKKESKKSEPAFLAKAKLYESPWISLSTTPSKPRLLDQENNRPKLADDLERSSPPETHNSSPSTHDSSPSTTKPSDSAVFPVNIHKELKIPTSISLIRANPLASSPLQFQMHREISKMNHPGDLVRFLSEKISVLDSSNKVAILHSLSKSLKIQSFDSELILYNPTVVSLIDDFNVESVSTIQELGLLISSIGKLKIKSDNRNDLLEQLTTKLAKSLTVPVAEAADAAAAAAAAAASLTTGPDSLPAIMADAMYYLSKNLPNSAIGKQTCFFVSQTFPNLSGQSLLKLSIAMARFDLRDINLFTRLSKIAQQELSLSQAIQAHAAMSSCKFSDTSFTNNVKQRILDAIIPGSEDPTDTVATIEFKLPSKITDRSAQPVVLYAPDLALFVASFSKSGSLSPESLEFWQEGLLPIISVYLPQFSIKELAQITTGMTSCGVPLDQETAKKVILAVNPLVSKANPKDLTSLATFLAAYKSLFVNSKGSVTSTTFEKIVHKIEKTLGTFSPFQISRIFNAVASSNLVNNAEKWVPVLSHKIPYMYGKNLVEVIHGLSRLEKKTSLEGLTPLQEKLVNGIVQNLPKLNFRDHLDILCSLKRLEAPGTNHPLSVELMEKLSTGIHPNLGIFNPTSEPEVIETLAALVYFRNVPNSETVLDKFLQVIPTLTEANQETLEFLASNIGTSNLKFSEVLRGNLQKNAGLIKWVSTLFEERAKHAETASLDDLAKSIRIAADLQYEDDSVLKIADEIELMWRTGEEKEKEVDLVHDFCRLRIKEDFCRNSIECLLSQGDAEDLAKDNQLLLKVLWSVCYLAETSLIDRTNLKLNGAVASSTSHQSQTTLRQTVNYMNLTGNKVTSHLEEMLEILESPKIGVPRKPLDSLKGSINSVLAVHGVGLLMKALEMGGVKKVKQIICNGLNGVEISLADNKEKLTVYLLGAMETVSPSSSKISAFTAMDLRLEVMHGKQVVSMSQAHFMDAIAKRKVNEFLRDELGGFIPELARPGKEDKEGSEEELCGLLSK